VVALPPRPVRTSRQWAVPVLRTPRAFAFGTATDHTLSPTTSLRAMLITLVTCLVLSIVVDAQGIVHSGHGMPDGIERTVTLDVGTAALSIGSVTHLTWAWSQLAAAHGYNPQPAVPPILASATGPAVRAAPGPNRTKPTPAVAVAGKPLGAARRTTTRPAGTQSPNSVPPIRIPTRRNPLRLLVTGDSLTEFMGPDVVNAASSTGFVHGVVDTHYGTGLVRPDFVDWSLVARQQMATYHSEAVVVMIGGNDFQNMQMPDGRILYTNTPEWTREYQRRAAVVMRAWIAGGARRVYWLSFPPARSAIWSRNNAQINLALRRAAAEVPGAQYVDILGPVTDRGMYTDVVTVHGQQVLVREPDGVHFNATGSSIVAGEILDFLQRDWHLPRG
jgi:uncharacterized protein